jgi:hypothetical protein
MLLDFADETTDPGLNRFVRLDAVKVSQVHLLIADWNDLGPLPKRDSLHIS